jgi:hypothetical protein
VSECVHEPALIQRPFAPSICRNCGARIVQIGQRHWLADEAPKSLRVPCADQRPPRDKKEGPQVIQSIESRSVVCAVCYGARLIGAMPCKWCEGTGRHDALYFPADESEKEGPQ